MLSKKQKEELKLIGVKKLINRETGEEIYVDFDDTPVFTWEEREKYRIGQPDMKPFSEMTEEDRKIFTETNE